MKVSDVAAVFGVLVPRAPRQTWQVSEVLPGLPDHSPGAMTVASSAASRVQAKSV
jgi:hypothetical protein